MLKGTWKRIGGLLMATMLLTDPSLDGRDLSSLRQLSVGGAPTPPAVLSPSSSTTPSASSSRTTADTVALVSPVPFARSARDVGPSRCSVPRRRLRFARRASSGVAIYSFV